MSEMIGVAKKVILGEALLVPHDTIVESWIWADSQLYGEKGEVHWHFDIGFGLTLSHINFPKGSRTFRKFLTRIETSEPRGEHIPSNMKLAPDDSRWSSPRVMRNRQLVREVGRDLQARIIDQFLEGEVAFSVLLAEFIQRYTREVAPRRRRAA